MRTAKFFGVVCLGWIAFAVGAQHAGASTQHAPKAPEPTYQQHKQFALPVLDLLVPKHESDGPKGDGGDKCGCSGGGMQPEHQKEHKQGDQNGDCKCDPQGGKKDDAPF